MNIRKIRQERYRVFHVCIDIDDSSEEHYEAFVRRLNAIEMDIDGVIVLGTDSTKGWPTVAVSETGSG